MTRASRVVLIDNFDSFVYNLAQAIGALGAEPIVVRNDRSLDEVVALRPDGLVISPGPGDPRDAGVSTAAIEHLGTRVPVLGVCLGHQCIGAVFGGSITRAPVGPVHGKTSMIEHDGKGVFADLPSPLQATRYHSLSIDERQWPSELEISARSQDGVVMGVRHNSLAIEGVQFHPESVLTPEGPQMLKNYLAVI